MPTFLNFGVPTSGEETLSILAGTVYTITADLAGPGNKRGALCMVVQGAINYSLHGSGTPDTEDFIAYAGDYFEVRPARMLRIVKNGTADCKVKVQGLE